MKEKIIEILKSHSYHHTEGVGVKSQFKYLAEVAFECCADEIMLALDQSQFTADEAEEHINQEVERRIAGLIPTKNEIGNAAQLFDKQKRPLWKEAIWRAGANWAVDIIRSRLSQKTDNLKENNNNGSTN